MSWSIQKRAGKPEKVRDLVAADLDAAAKNYAGKTEEQDVLGAKTAILSWLDESKCDETEGVEVAANGSRGWGLTVNVTCSKIKLAI